MSTLSVASCGVGIILLSAPGQRRAHWSTGRDILIGAGAETLTAGSGGFRPGLAGDATESHPRD